MISYFQCEINGGGGGIRIAPNGGGGKNDVKIDDFWDWHELGKNLRRDFHMAELLA